MGGLDKAKDSVEPKDTKSLPLASSKPIEVEVEPIYFHDCPALGPHTRTVKAYRGNKDGSEIYGWQYKCPFCSHTEGEFHRVTDLASNNPEASAELSNPPKDMDTSKSLDDKLRNVLWEVGHNSINSSDAISQIKQAIVEAVEGIYGDSDGLREFASTPTNQVVNPNVNKRKAA